MTDSELIWKFLSREYPDDHVAVYLYVCGHTRSPNTAMEKVIPLVITIFSPPLSENFVKTVVKAFFDNKKRQYLKGEIKVKSIY